MKRALAFVIIQVVLRSIQYLSVASLHQIARILGAVIYRWPSIKHDIVQENLRVAFPELSESQRNQLARKNATQMACFALETGLVWHADAEKLESVITEVKGWEQLSPHATQGRGTLLVGAHFGNWEILNLYCMHHLQMTALYKAPKDDQINQWIKLTRERFGGTLVPSGSQAMRALLKTLKSGGVAGIIADQQPRQGDGVMAPFFNAPALTMTLVNRLAQKTGCQVLMASCFRQQGLGFSIEITPLDPSIADPDPVVAATTLNHALESAISLRPEQYLWRYRRYS